jgi:hypothetical protein
VGVGVGVGVAGAGVGDELGAGVLARLGAFFFAGFGSGPEGVNDASFGAAGTLTGVTADGAAALSLPPELALPMPNAAPKATTTTATAMAANRPGVIGRCRSRRAGS